MKKYLHIIFFVGFLILLNGCSTSEHNYYSGIQSPMTNKEKVESFIKYIATTEEKDELAYLDSDKDLEVFLVNFWKKRDPDPMTKINEFKEEHVKRFTYANVYLGGWKTDRARVYIVYGVPDDIISEPMNYIPANIFADYEIWVYDKMTLHPEIPNVFSSFAYGKVKFVFANRMGFGVKQQIYSTEDNEKIDPRIYRIFEEH